MSITIGAVGPTEASMRHRKQLAELKNQTHELQRAANMRPREVRTSGGLRSQAAERVQKAYQQWRTKETRKCQAGAAKRSAFLTTIGT
jgi:hypothetical protein